MRVITPYGYFHILAAAMVVTQSFGQKYNLNHVDVKLLNGQDISGRLLGATEDSLIMSDKNKPFEGCAVTITSIHRNMTLNGTIKAITRSTISVSTKEEPYVQEVHRSQIKRIDIKSFPKSADVETLQRSAYSYNELEYVGIHKIGSGGLGVLIGGAAGAGLGWLMSGGSQSSAGNSNNSQTTNTYNSNQGILPTGAGSFSIEVPGEVFGLFIGATVGGAVASSNKHHHIDGKKERFVELVRRLKILR